MDSADILRIAVVIELYNSMHQGLLSALSDVNRLETAFQNLSRNANFQFSAAQKTAYNVSRGAVAVGVGMTAIGLGLKSLLMTTVDPAQRMQSAMMNFKIATEDTHRSTKELIAELAKLQDYSFKISAQTQFSAPDVAGFATILATLGFHDPKQILGTGKGPDAYKQSTLMVAAQFAEVMRATKKVDPTTAVQEAGRIAGILGWIDPKHPDKFKRGLDELYHAALLTPASLSQIRTPLGQMASIPASMLSSEDRLMIAAFSGRISSGRQGNQLATEFQRLIPAMFGRGSKGQLAALEAAGFMEKDQKTGKYKLDYFNDKGQFIGWDAFLRLFEQKMARFSPEQQSALLTGISGSTGAKALGPYLQHQVLVDYEQMLADAKKMESLTRAQKDLLGTNVGQLNYMKTNWENVRTILGNSILPTLTHIYTMIGNILAGVTDWLQAHPVIADWLAKIALAITGISLVLGPVLIFFGTLGIAVTGVMGLVSAFGGLAAIAGTLIGPLALVAGAITAIVLGWRLWSSAGSFGMVRGPGKPELPEHVKVGGVTIPIAVAAKALKEGGTAARLSIQSGINAHLNRVRAGLHEIPPDVTREIDLMLGRIPKLTQPPRILSHEEFIARQEKVFGKVYPDLLKDMQRKRGLGGPEMDVQIKAAYETLTKNNPPGAKPLKSTLSMDYADYLKPSKGIQVRFARQQASFDKAVKERAEFEALRTRLESRVSSVPLGKIDQQRAVDAELREFIKTTFPSDMQAQLNSLVDRVPYATKRGSKLLPVHYTSLGDAAKGIARGLSPVNTPKEMVTQAKSLGSNLKTTVGSLTDDIGAFVQAVRGLFDVFKGGLSPLERIGVLFGRLGELLRGVLIPTKALAGIGRLLWDVFKIPIDPLQLILLALQGLAQAVFKHMPEIKKTINDTWNEITRQVRVALTTVQTQFEDIFGKGSSKSLLGIVQKFFDFFQFLTDEAQRAFEGAWPGVATVFKGVWKIIEGIFTVAWAAIKLVLQVFHDVTIWNFKDLGTQCTDAIKTLWGGIKLIFEGAYDTFLKGPMEALTGALESVFMGVFVNIKQQVIDFFLFLSQAPVVGGKFRDWANALKAGNSSATAVAHAVVAGQQATVSGHGAAGGISWHMVRATSDAGAGWNRFSDQGFMTHDTDFGMKFGTPVALGVSAKYLGAKKQPWGWEEDFLGPHKEKFSFLHLSALSKAMADPKSIGKMFSSQTFIGNSGIMPVDWAAHEFLGMKYKPGLFASLSAANQAYVNSQNFAHLCIVTDDAGYKYLVDTRDKTAFPHGPTGGGGNLRQAATTPAHSGPVVHIENMHLSGYSDPQKAGEDFVKSIHKAAYDAFSSGPMKGQPIHLGRP